MFLYVKTETGDFVPLSGMEVAKVVDGANGAASIEIGESVVAADLASREYAQTILGAIFGAAHAAIQENERFIVIGLTDLKAQFPEPVAESEMETEPDLAAQPGTDSEEDSPVTSGDANAPGSADATNTPASS